MRSSIDCCVVRSLVFIELFVNVAAEHVAAETEHRAWVGELGAAHVRVGEVDRGLDEALGALAAMRLLNSFMPPTWFLKTTSP
jgi:hypothetical protein